MHSPKSESAKARFAVSAIFFLDGAALGVWLPHIATVRANLHLSNGLLGMVLLGSPIGAVIAMPFAGALIHRFGSRRLCIALSWIVCAAVPWLVVAPSVPWFMFALFLFGAGNGLLDVCMNAHSVVVQDRFDRPILSAVHGWYSVGGFVGGGLVALSARFGVPPIFRLAASSAALALIPLAVGRMLLPSHVDKNAEGPKLAIPRGVLLVIGVMAMFSFLSEGASLEWATVYYRTVRHAPEYVAALGFGLASGGMAFGRLCGDFAVHRAGAARTLQLSALLAAVGMLLAVSAPTDWGSILGFMLVGLGLANQVPVLFLAAANQPGISGGVGIAAVTTCGYFAFLGGPPSIGAVAQARGLGFALGLVSILMVFVGIVGPKVVGRRRSPELAQEAH